MALALSVALSACGLHTGRGWILSVHTLEGSPKRASKDTEPTERAEETTGTVVVARGEIEGEPSQLWLYVPKTVTGGRGYSAPPAMGQLFWGSSYASRRLEARLRFSEDFFRATVELEASEPEIDDRNRGDERFVFEAEVVAGDALRWGKLPAGTLWLPPRDPEVPETRPVVAGQTPPEGYVLESYRRWDLAGLGLAAFTVSYGIPVVIAAGNDFEDGSKVLTVPVLGPLVVYGRFLRNVRENGCCVMGLLDYGVYAIVTGVLVGTSALQLGGLTLFGVAALREERRWVYAPKPVTIQPWVSPAGAGAGVTGRF